MFRASNCNTAARLGFPIKISFLNPSDRRRLLRRAARIISVVVINLNLDFLINFSELKIYAVARIKASFEAQRAPILKSFKSINLLIENTAV